MAGGELEYGSTPSWVIGAVVFLMVAISWVVEKLLSFVGQASLPKSRSIILHVGMVYSISMN